MHNNSNTGLLMRFLKGSKRYFITAVIFTIIMTVLELLPPRIIQFTVDSVLDNKEPDLPSYFLPVIDVAGGVGTIRANLWMIALALVIIAIFAVLSKYVFNVSNAKGAEYMIKNMRDTTFTHIQKLPFSWHTENMTGDIIQRCTSDISTIQLFFSESVVSVLRIVIMIVTAIVFMFGINVKLALIASIFIPVVLANSLYFHIKMKKGFTECDENEGILSQIIQENLSGVRVVRAFGKESYETDRFEAQNKKYTSLWSKYMKILSAYFTIADGFVHTQMIILIVLGAIMCINGEAGFTIGKYIAFLSYNSMMIWPVNQLGRILSETSKTSVALGRINKIMSAEVEKDPDDATKPEIKGKIEFKNVNYGFGEKVALSDISFTVPAGTTLGILGSTGSGKSTIIALIDKLYDLGDNDGTILIDGHDIKTIDRKYLRKNISVVLQEPFLFSRTIEENIKIANENATDEEMRRCSKISCLSDTISSFVKGYKTEVGEKGVTLSGGQKQRCAIARMLMQDSKILIFDDSLSAVDMETDAKIREALKDETKGKTVLLIAQRISTIMHSDNIIVLDKGRIVDQGTHEQLLSHDGLYKKIYDLQTSITEEVQQ